MSIPNDEQLLAAVKALRVKEPALARTKVLKQLKEENGWELSEKRLRACMDEHNLGSSVVPASSVAPEARTKMIEKPRDASYDEIVKNAFQEFTRLEREFLLGLSQSDCEALMPIPGMKNLNLLIACQQRHHVEILLTLKGLKPCTGIHHHISTHIFTRLVNEILKPLMKKYDLESYGFVLRQIKHGTMMDLGRHRPVKFWEGGWIFTDVRHPLWPEVQSILLPSQQLNITRHGHDAYQDRVGKALGYPVPRYPRSANSNTVRYIDETERRVLQKFRTKEDEFDIAVIGLEYEDDDGNPETWKACLLHVGYCAQAMASVGSELRPDLSDHAPLSKTWTMLKSR